MKIRPHSLLITGLIASNLTLADTPADAIIVTATRTAQVADQTLAPVIVIDRQQIDRSPATDIADLLRLQAGLDIGRSGGPGQATSLFLRGTNSDHTLVMIDGVKINPGTNGGAALMHILPDQIERIEIVKGPRSTLYGSEAIGGVINIITRQADKDQYRLQVEGGTFNTQRTNLTVSHATGHLQMGIDASHAQTDGFPSKTSSQLDRAYTNNTLKGQIKGQVGVAHLALTHWQADGNNEYLDFSLNPVAQDYQNSRTALRVDLSVNDLWQSQTTLAYVTDEIDQNQSSDFAHTRRTTVDWQNDINLTDDQLLTAGLYFSHEDTTSLIFGTGYDVTTDITAMYLQDDVNLDRHHVILSGRYNQHEDFGNHATWNIDYGYALSDHTRLTAGAGTAFRSPDSNARFGSGGNPTLQPETSLNLELGLRHDLGKRHNISFSLFQNQIDQLITYPAPAFTATNIDQATILGAEFDYQVTYENWGLKFSAISQNPENDNTGTILARRAENTATLSTFYQWGIWILNSDFMATSSRKDSDFSTIINPGYGLLNLGLLGRINPALQVSFKVENVLDKQYTLAHGFNTADRSVYVGIRYQGDY